MTILEAVNPKVSTDEKALVAKSLAVCKSILAGDSSDKVLALTQAQFTNGSYVPSPAEADAMDRAVTSTFCR